IKQQYNHASCELLSNLKLEYGCIPFDQMPFNSALINHNPKLSDLFASINTDDRKHEILARHIKNNTEQKRQLYTQISEIENFENIEDLIDEWNDNLYWKHKNRCIEIYKKHAFIKGYEADTYNIIEKLKEVSSDGIKNYKNSIESWLQSTSYVIDCDEKKLALKNL